MTVPPNRCAELKRRIRRLKKLEIKIRFGGSAPAGQASAAGLVWDAFFDLREAGVTRARYSIRILQAMGKEELKSVEDEFFYTVYDRFYRENGISDIRIYDLDMLTRLGLPPDADDAAIKKRFHELAMQYHPDTGGDAARFIKLMEDYRKLIEKGK